mgnify:CR=1 FL=1
MVDENEEIVKIEEVNKKLFKDIIFIKKMSLICAKIGLTLTGYYTSFLLGSVVLSEENLNNFQLYGISLLSIINFISSIMITQNIKKERKNAVKDINYEILDISDIFKSNRNIILLSLLYGVTGLSMNELIDICKIEETKNILMSTWPVINTLSIILLFYGNCYIGNIDKYIEKVYKK